MPTAVVSGPTVAIQPATKQCGQNPRPTQLLNLLADDGLPDSAGKIVSVMAAKPSLKFFSEHDTTSDAAAAPFLMA